MSRDNYGGGAGSVMVAFMMGAVAGATLALLFAPASGDETREYLSQKARESRDKAREAVEQGREFYQRQRDSVGTAIERGREAYQQARERGEQA